jgi:hypothetical protein
VLLIGRARPLERALRTALSPWGLRVQRLESRGVELELQGAADRAAVLAQELDADALIWLGANSRGETQLWLYDATRGTTSARSMPNALIDARLSAALALSIKTALRSSSPRTTDAPATNTTPTKTAPTASAPAQTASALPSVGPLDGDSAPTATGSRAAELRLALSTALRWGALSRGLTEQRYGVELRWAPWARPLWEETDLWLSVRFDLGDEPRLVSSSFKGRYSQTGAGLAVGVSRRWGSFVDLGGQLGVCVDRGSLSGTLLSDGTRAAQSRFGATVVLRPELAFSVGPLALLLQPGLGAAIGRQRYVADGQVVLETGHFSGLLGMGLRLNVQ